jgi:hypothetical protein
MEVMKTKDYLEKELGKRSSYVDWKSFLCFQQVSMAITIAVLARQGGFHITAVGAMVRHNQRHS